MTTPFFTSTAQLRAFVKLNASLPWDSLSPYVDAGVRLYLLKYLSQAKLDLLEPNEEFMTLARRALAPLAVYLAADEMSVSIGDSGITVQNEKDRRSPASDRKIAAAKRSLLRRGCAALSDLLQFVLSLDGLDLHDCPRLAVLSSLLVRRIEDFETFVSIDGSYVTFLDLVPLMRSVQDRLAAETDPALIGSLLSTSSSEGTLRAVLKDRCVSYIVYQTASLHTSLMTRQQRKGSHYTEWEPLMRPLFEDVADSGSWYRDMASRALADITRIIGENAAELGMEQRDISVNFNGRGRRIFSM